MTLGALSAVMVGVGVLRRTGAYRRIDELHNARFRAIIEASTDYFLILSPEGRITYRSPSVESATRHLPAPNDLEDLLGFLDSSSAQIAREAFFNGAPSAGPLKVNIDATLGQRWIELRLTDETANPAVRGTIINARDITAQEGLALELTQQARIDVLTGLPNRRAVNLEAETMIGRCAVRGQGVGLLLIDLDGFKAVNDTLGHPVGDALLREVAVKLTRATRGGEMLARLGGDEFAVLIEDIGLPEARALADRLLATLRHPIQVGNHEIPIGASIGIAVLSTSARVASTDGRAGELMRQADMALYEAKHRGRGRAVAFDQGIAERAEVEARLLRQVVEGFRRGQFYLVYQPLVRTNNQETVAFEALMRWQSPVLGSVPPSTFIPIAERTGAIIRMGRWALTEACNQLAAWNRVVGDRSLSVSVNISRHQLTDDDLPTFVAELLARTDIDASQLQLEVTEATLSHDPEDVTAPLRALRALGVMITIDDFGTGYSSLAQLEDLPVDCIKIDRAFTSRVDGSSAPGSVLRAVIDLAQALDVTVVAEGVEQLEQLNELRRHDIQLAQGFLFAHPLDAKEVEPLLRSMPSDEMPASGLDDVPGR